MRGRNLGTGLGGYRLTDAVTTTDTPADALEPYRTRVREARLTRSEDLIYNNSHEHAAVLIEELFLCADREVGVLCHDLNRPVYGSAGVIAAARSFMSRPGAQLSIISDDQLDDDHPLLTAINELTAEGASVRRIVKPDEFGFVGFNFMVADQCAYLFESDASEPYATACFNAPDLAAKMYDIVNVMFGVAPETAVTQEEMVA